MPDEVLRVVKPEIGKVFGLLRGILEAAKENYIVLEVGHSMATSCWRSLALALYSGPFSVGGFEAPELLIISLLPPNTFDNNHIIVVIESSLLR